MHSLTVSVNLFFTNLSAATCASYPRINPINYTVLRGCLCVLDVELIDCPSALQHLFGSAAGS